MSCPKFVQHGPGLLCVDTLSFTLWRYFMFQYYKPLPWDIQSSLTYCFVFCGFNYLWLTAVQRYYIENSRNKEFTSLNDLSFQWNHTVLLHGTREMNHLFVQHTYIAHTFLPVSYLGAIWIIKLTVIELMIK